MATIQFDPIGKFKYTKNDMNQYHSYNDMPAIEYLDGSSKIWYKNGLIHRENQPAIITKDTDEYYFEGKLHSHNIGKPAIIIKEFDKIKKKLYYYMGEKLIGYDIIKYEDKTQTLFSKKNIKCCIICKKICRDTDFYNKIYNKVYCSICNKLTEIYTINFEFKTITNLEMLNLIKNHYNLHKYNNRFIDINQITEDEITNPSNPNFINIVYNYNNYTKHIDYIIRENILNSNYDGDYEFITIDNKLYIPNILLNFRATYSKYDLKKIFDFYNNSFINIDNDALFDIGNIYFIFNDKKIEQYDCMCLNKLCEEYKIDNEYEICDGFGGGHLFGFNIAGDKVICNNYNPNIENKVLDSFLKECSFIHDSKFITLSKKIKCYKCKKEYYKKYMGGVCQGNLSYDICKYCSKKNSK
jgi:hypothetical protein